jgi:predicted unusual protein kinase regulating ubiquinone biosynthesis (AarF/ABC1/UbiB family)
MSSDTEQLQAWKTGRPTRFRAQRAYWLTARILAGYLWLRLWKPVLGQSLYQRRLIARHHRTSAQLTAAILDLGGLFIKVGQLISILSNFLPPEFRAALEQLQDRVPARPLPEVQARIRKDLGRSPEELFADFDPIPIASASLAQVHVAHLHDGRKVAVKVQHADIETIAAIDLTILRRVFAVVQLLVRIRGLEEYPEDIAQMIREELDFRQEARNIAVMTANFAGNAEVSFPVVVPELSTQRVLTTEFVEGAKITDFAALSALGVDRAMLARRVLRAMCQMVFVDGVFHADPHPGNIMVRPDGTVTFLDLGAIGHLLPNVMTGIRRLWMGVIKGDPALITAGLREAGLISRDADDAEIAERAIAYFQRRFLEQVQQDSWSIKELQFDIKSRVDALVDLTRLDISFSDLTRAFQVPKEWVLFERGAILTLGLYTELDPDMNPIHTVGPYLQQFVLGKDADAKGTLLKAVQEMAMATIAIPDKANRVLDLANRGQVTFQMGGLRESALLLYAAIHQVLFALLAGGFGALAVSLGRQGHDALGGAAWAVVGICLIAMIRSLVRARALSKKLRGRPPRV